MKYVNNVYKKIKKCRISDDTNLFSVAKFPLMGLTGTFPKNNYQKIKKHLSKLYSQKNQIFCSLDIIIIQTYYMEKITVIDLV